MIREKPEGCTDLDWYLWPECIIPFCPNKCCLALDSPYCFPHTRMGQDTEELHKIIEELREDELQELIAINNRE